MIAALFKGNFMPTVSIKYAAGLSASDAFFDNITTFLKIEISKQIQKPGNWVAVDVYPPMRLRCKDSRTMSFEIDMIYNEERVALLSKEFLEYLRVLLLELLVIETRDYTHTVEVWARSCDKSSVHVM